jgi:hypothetical protein
VHGEEDTPELQQKIRGMLKDEGESAYDEMPISPA